MGLLYLSLESGFLCFTALPDGLVPHLHPASVSFPPRSPGKGQKNDEHDDWSSSNQWWRRRDGDLPAENG